MRFWLHVFFVLSLSSTVSHGQSRLLEFPVPGETVSWHPAISRNGSVLTFSNAGLQDGKLDIWALALPSAAPELVSAAPDKRPANNHSFQSSLSADGRFVAFDSGGSDLIPGDLNGAFDIFVHDRLLRTTERVSVSEQAIEADGPSNSAFITPDGRYVAFTSNASNLVISDTNSAADVFVFDRLNKTIERVSVGDAGEADKASSSSTISDDGRYVSFMSTATNLISGRRAVNWGVYVRDRVAQKTELISAPLNGFSWRPVISGNGRFVAFESNSTELEPALGSSVNHIYVYDRETSAVKRITRGAAEPDGGSSFPQISADGRYIAFFSSAENLTAGDINAHPDLFLYDGITEVIENLTREAPLLPVTSIAPSMSADAKAVAFAASYLGRTQIAISRLKEEQTGCSQIPLRLPPPRVVCSKRNLQIQLFASNCAANYQIELRSKKRILRKKSRIAKAVFKKVPKGTYKLIYTMILKDQQTIRSGVKSLRVK